ncbi:MAG: hypothetical protein LBJ00_07680 [Planctomycetaceae bacterium]|jgi:hypothetical protein|nr:hypothetical protein [Planctomycetaceae bacterium]
MSTRATIKFLNGSDIRYVYRYQDGYPSVVLDDLHLLRDKLITEKFDSTDLDKVVLEFFKLVRCLVGDLSSPYQITRGVQYDESYLYEFKWDQDNKTWNCDVNDGYDPNL